jgi:hypothetical protein
VIPTPDAQGERLRYPVGASAHSGHSASNRLQIGCPPGPWKESGLVFTTAVGTQMDPANVCRDLRRALKLVPGREPEDRKTSRFLEREVPQPQPTMSPWWPLMADGE